MTVKKFTGKIPSMFAKEKPDVEQRDVPPPTVSDTPKSDTPKPVPTPSVKPTSPSPSIKPPTAVNTPSPSVAKSPTPAPTITPKSVPTPSPKPSPKVSISPQVSSIKVLPPVEPIEVEPLTLPSEVLDMAMSEQLYEVETPGKGSHFMCNALEDLYLEDIISKQLLMKTCELIREKIAPYSTVFTYLYAQGKSSGRAERCKFYTDFIKELQEKGL